MLLLDWIGWCAIQEMAHHSKLPKLYAYVSQSVEEQEKN